MTAEKTNVLFVEGFNIVSERNMTNDEIATYLRNMADLFDSKTNVFSECRIELKITSK